MNHPDLFNLPSLSLGEKERHFAIARELMRENDVRGLLVFPDPHPAEPYDVYLTNDFPGAIVVLPLEGEPTAIFPGSHSAGAYLQSEERGEESWIKDWRFLPPGPAVVGILKEKGLDGTRVGTVGVTKGGHFSPAGNVPYALWCQITANLPNVRFVELADQFILRWLVKSEEELALVRHAAAIAEAACEVMLDITKPGVTEAAIYAGVQYEIQRYGIRSNSMILHSGTDNIGWSSPKWQFRSQRSRTIQPGDIVLSELFPWLGPIHVQAQMCIGVGELSPAAHHAARLAREAYEIGLRAIRPGIKFSEVAEAMSAPLKREGAWHLTPMLHSLTPVYCAGPVTEGIRSVPGFAERFPHVFERPITAGDVILEKGMTFQLEPNACLGRVRINIGGNVIVTEQGCEALNSLPCELRCVPA